MKRPSTAVSTLAAFPLDLLAEALVLLLSLASLNSIISFIRGHDCDLGSICCSSVFPPLRGNENVKTSRENEPNYHNYHDDMCDCKCEYVERIHALLVEGWICERHDNAENRTRYVANNWSPEERNSPILSGGYDRVEVACKLVALHMAPKLEQDIQGNSRGILTE